MECAAERAFYNLLRSSRADGSPFSLFAVELLAEALNIHAACENFTAWAKYDAESRIK
jgi:hypothetical protein